MKNDLIKAKEIFIAGNYTCVLCRGEKTYKSIERGVKPLVMWIDSKTDLSGFSAVDKVVGKAAAMLYVILKVNHIYAEVMSEAAVKVFSKYGIESQSGIIIKEIRNRQNTGSCPMEIAVRSTEAPLDAYKAVKHTIISLGQDTPNIGS